MLKVATVLLAFFAQLSDPTVSTMTSTTTISDVMVRDVNEDGIADVFVLGRAAEEEHGQKSLDLFLSTGEQQYPRSPDLSMQLDALHSGIFFAEIDGTPPVEIVAVHGRGASIYSFTNDAVTSLGAVGFQSLLPSAVRKPSFLRRTAVDIDGDGVHEWLIPVDGGIEIRHFDGLVSKVEIHASSTMTADGDALTVTHRIPACQVLDLPGQPHKALAFLNGQHVDIAYGDMAAKHDRVTMPVEIDEQWQDSASLRDLNGDQLPDLVITRTQGTVDLKVRTQIHLAVPSRDGAPPFTFDRTPLKTFHFDGALTSPLLADMNGDERPDLLFAGVPFSVGTFINYLFRKKLTVSFEVHHFSDGSYPDKPSLEDSVTIRVPELRASLAYTMGDFSGDGRMDYAFGDGPDRIGIYEGSDEDMISKYPTVNVDLPSLGKARTVKLDANSPDDIVLFNPDAGQGRTIHVIAF